MKLPTLVESMSYRSDVGLVFKQIVYVPPMYVHTYDKVVDRGTNK